MNKNIRKPKTIKSCIKIYIKTLPKFLSGVFIICIVFIFIYKLYLIDIKEIFNNASRVGDIFYNLSLAYSASFIFYFITIYIKEQRDKKIYYKLVSLKIKNIVDNTKDFVSLAANHINYKLKNEYPTNEDIEEIFTNTNSNDETNVYYIKDSEFVCFTYVQYLRKQITSNKELIQSMYTKMQFLDSEFVELLSKIENNPVSTCINMYTNAPLCNPNLYVIGLKYYSYMQLIKELEKYYYSKIKLYSLE